MPFLERLYRRLEPGVLEIWAVAQEMPDTAAAYADQLGLTFPQMVDPDLEATEALDLNHVPSLFLLNPDGTILRHMTGFHRGWLEEIASEFSPHAGPLFAPDENVPPMKPG
jgi:peroxiredoxin